MPTRYFYREVINNYYLGKSKVIKAETRSELEYKKSEQLIKWREQEARARKKEATALNIDRAEYNTKEALLSIERFKNILNDSLSKEFKLDFSKYIDNSKYKCFDYEKKKISLDSVYEELNVPKKSFWEFILKNIKYKRIVAEEKAKKVLKERINQEDEKYTEALKKYNEEKAIYEKVQQKGNKEILTWKENFEAGEVKAVHRYIEEVLKSSFYPEEIDKEFEIEYRKEDKLIIISYKLPSPEIIPNIIEYKYVKTRNEVDVKKMKTADFNKFYDDIIYQITLRTINEIFKSTYNNCVMKIVFNGWVDYVDEATGNDASSCIISVMVDKADFEDINLAKVNYKECIKRLKGIFAGKLISLVPIKPILNLKKEDDRFIESKDVLAEVNSGTNLASMDWHDFEQLVRELFQYKFSSDGSEVKITQSSRDGGVDAVIFDTDPFKGGKFIIQAKRYNNVVPVAAVRDLYGTMIHENAVRAILVTTSNYGSDSYDFIKDKPVTLINGNELLGLFNELGYKDLRIKLWEDRKENK